MIPNHTKRRQMMLNDTGIYQMILNDAKRC